MKKYIIILFLFIFSSCTTCILNNTIDQSSFEFSINEKESFPNSEGKLPDKNNGEVVYIKTKSKFYKRILVASLYTLYPFTVTFDIITLPIQIVMAIYAMKDYSDKMAGRKY